MTKIKEFKSKKIKGKKHDNYDSVELYETELGRLFINVTDHRYNDTEHASTPLSRSQAKKLRDALDHWLEIR